MPTDQVNPIPAIGLVGPDLAPPADKRVPFGWPAFAVPAPGTGAVILRWPKLAPRPEPLALRLTTAIDDRECKRIAVRDAAGAYWGEFDLRYAHALETFCVILPVGAPVAAGLHLTMTAGTSPLWCLAPSAAAAGPGLAPHLLTAGPPADPTAVFLAQLRAPECQHT